MYYSPAASKSPSDVLKTQLIGMLCQDSLNEYAYYADIAGLDYGIEDNHEGLEVSIGPGLDTKDLV